MTSPNYKLNMFYLIYGITLINLTKQGKCPFYEEIGGTCCVAKPDEKGGPLRKTRELDYYTLTVHPQVKSTHLKI